MFTETAERDGFAQTTTFNNELVVGQEVAMTSKGHDWSAVKKGVYVGTLADEEEGTPYRYFVYGEINGTTQRCFGFPAPMDTALTSDLTPTTVIGTWLACRGK